MEKDDITSEREEREKKEEERKSAGLLRGKEYGGGGGGGDGDGVTEGVQVHLTPINKQHKTVGQVKLTIQYSCMAAHSNNTPTACPSPSPSLLPPFLLCFCREPCSPSPYSCYPHSRSRVRVSMAPSTFTPNLLFLPTGITRYSNPYLHEFVSNSIIINRFDKESFGKLIDY